MQLLSIEETNAIKIQAKGRNPSSIWLELKPLLELCNIGQSVILKREEWKLKTGLSAFTSQSYRKGRSDKKFSVKSLFDKTGWLIIRIK